MMTCRSMPVTATGTVVSAGPGMLFGAKLAAGSDTATAVIRDGGASGTIVAKLAAVANTGDAFMPPGGIPFSTDLHVTLTGTSPHLNVLT